MYIYIKSLHKLCYVYIYIYYTGNIDIQDLTKTIKIYKTTRFTGFLIDRGTQKTKRMREKVCYIERPIHPDTEGAYML